MRPQTQLTPAFTPHATITLAYHGLELRCPSANLSENRPFTPDPLADFSIRYQKIARDRNLTAPLDLLALGQELFAWL